MCVLTFRGPFASHASNPYPHRNRIARCNATKLMASLDMSLSCKSTWGGLKWGRRYSSSVGHSSLRRTFPLHLWPTRPQMCTIADDRSRAVESGLKPPFEKPHVDFPQLDGPIQDPSRTSRKRNDFLALCDLKPQSACEIITQIILNLWKRG